MHHYVYKITNKTNGKYYIGYHFGELDDGYHGSGKLISSAIKKHGKHNFQKEVITIASNEVAGLFLEKAYVGDLWQTDKKCYNCTPGGGMPPSQTGKKLPPLSDEHKAKISAFHTGKPLSDEHKAKLAASHTGKTHSDETKRKMSEARNEFWAKRKGLV